MRAWLVRSCIALPLLVPAAVTAQSTMFPEWMGRRVDVLGGSREALIDDRSALFAAAPATSGATLDDAVLLCRIQVQNPEGDRWDTFADPDLRVTLSAGRYRAVAWGTENTDDEIVSFAGVSLTPGAHLRFRVIDRDVTYDEAIGSVSTSFDGTLPFTAAHGHVRIECRAMNASVGAGRRDAALARAGEVITHAERALPDLSAADLGAPRTTDAEAALVDAIAYAGIRNGDVRAMIARLRSAETRFAGLLRTAIREAQRSAPRRGVAVEHAGSRVSALELSCGRGAVRRFPMVDPSTRCVVVLALEPAATAPASILGIPDVIDARGLGPASTGVFLDPTEPSHVVVAFDARVTSRMLLRIGLERRTLLALR